MDAPLGLVENLDQQGQLACQVRSGVQPRIRARPSSLRFSAWYLGFIKNVLDRDAFTLDFIQRRLGDINAIISINRGILPEKERQQQRADVRPCPRRRRSSADLAKWHLLRSNSSARARAHADDGANFSWPSIFSRAADVEILPLSGGSPGCSDAWPWRPSCRPNHLNDKDFRINQSRWSSPTTCPADCRCSKHPCGASTRAPCEPPRGPAPPESPCSKSVWPRPGSLPDTSPTAR